MAERDKCRVALHRAGETSANGFIEAFNGRLRDELLRHYGARAPILRLVAAG
jgi:hypothetical protein